MAWQIWRDVVMSHYNIVVRMHMHSLEPLARNSWLSKNRSVWAGIMLAQHHMS
jgi:hypothetical protein